MVWNEERFTPIENVAVTRLQHDATRRLINALHVIVIVGNSSRGTASHGRFVTVQAIEALSAVSISVHFKIDVTS